MLPCYIRYSSTLDTSYHGVSIFLSLNYGNDDDDNIKHQNQDSIHFKHQNQDSIHFKFQKLKLL